MIDSKRSLALVLTFIYATLGGAALVQNIRVFKVTGCRRKWTFQKRMLALLALSAFSRAALFTAMTANLIRLDRITSPLHTDFGNPGNYALSSIPGLCFFTTFCVLVAYWAELYYAASGDVDVYRKKIRPLVLFLVAGSWSFYFVFLFLSDKHMRKRYRAVLDGYFSLALFVIGTAVTVFGFRALSILKAVPVERDIRLPRLNELWTLTVLCVIAFFTRCIVAVVVAVVDGNEITEIEWYCLATAYYVILEVTPLAALLWYQRRLPPAARIEALSFDIILSKDLLDDDGGSFE
eukprot:g2357.t1